MIRSVLVANRGEIARRVFRTCKAMGIGTVAVYSDADATAPFVGEADLAVRLPGRSPAETYLRGDLVIAAALKAGADAIHPGYGFLSENAGFARAVADAGFTFIGPSAGAIAAMGSKIAAKQMMAAAGVPVLGSINVADVADYAAAAGELGYPLLVKASFGGGGRGMREVRAPGELTEAVEGAQREAASAFGDGTVFLETLVERPRHVEVQIFGDMHGHVVALFERECSIQRRHQKVVEEAPSPAVDPALREKLCASAVAAAKALDYTGAGTVEFLLAPDGRYFFLEVNTRLQVEHPVTEGITGLDLVRLQLEVAAGFPLPPSALEPTINGHAVEVRLYAEDPARSWLPQAGLLSTVAIPGTGGAGPFVGVRNDSGVESGSVVGVDYDPMLAKVMAWAPTRAEAAVVLADALARAHLHGLVTNRDLLVNTLRHPAFLAGRTHTGFFDEHGLDTLAAPLLPPAQLAAHVAAAALGQAALRRSGATTWAGLPSGWRSNPTQLQSVGYDRRLDGAVVPAHDVRYSLPALSVLVDGTPLALEAVDVTPTGVALTVDGVRTPYAVTVVGEQVYVDSVHGSLSLLERPRFPDPTASVAPGSLTATMPGTVVRVLVADGDAVTAGQTLLVLEAMKMEHPVVAPVDGTVSGLGVAAGTQVETGAVLAVVT